MEYRFREFIPDPRCPVAICQIEALVLTLIIGENMTNYEVSCQVFQRALHVGRAWMGKDRENRFYPRGHITHYGLTQDRQDRYLKFKLFI